MEGMDVCHSMKNILLSIVYERCFIQEKYKKISVLSTFIFSAAADNGDMKFVAD